MAAASSEIVLVCDGRYLINSERRRCPYMGPAGRPLRSGFYFVLRPVGSCDYEHRIRYFGPFPSHVVADKVALCAAYLGLAAPSGSAGEIPGTRDRLPEPPFVPDLMPASAGHSTEDGTALF